MSRQAGPTAEAGLVGGGSANGSPHHPALVQRRSSFDGVKVDEVDGATGHDPHRGPRHSFDGVKVDEKDGGTGHDPHRGPRHSFDGVKVDEKDGATGRASPTKAPAAEEVGQGAASIAACHTVQIEEVYDSDASLMQVTDGSILARSVCAFGRYVYMEFKVGTPLIAHNRYHSPLLAALAEGSLGSLESPCFCIDVCRRRWTALHASLKSRQKVIWAHDMRLFLLAKPKSYSSQRMMLWQVWAHRAQQCTACVMCFCCHGFV
jgi:hypothetical protein